MESEYNHPFKIEHTLGEKAMIAPSQSSTNQNPKKQSRMKMGRPPKLFFKILIFTGFFPLHGQDASQKAMYNAFDEAVGIENTGLYQGVVYVEKYRTINERVHFYKGVDFFPGGVRYDGQWYYNTAIKYDVYDDEVLLRLITEAGGGTIKLFKNYLEGFILDGEHFVKILEDDAPLLKEHGFYAISMEGTYFTLYTKYTKRSFEKRNKRFLYYEFLDGPSEYVLLYKGQFHTFNSKKEVIDLFQGLKKEIKAFYAFARLQRKSDPDGFMVSLAKRIEILLSQSDLNIVE